MDHHLASGKVEHHLPHDYLSIRLAIACTYMYLVQYKLQNYCILVNKLMKLSHIYAFRKAAILLI